MKEYCCDEYKFCRENGFIMFDEGYSNHLIIKFYNPKEELPMNHHTSVLKFCPFCGKNLNDDMKYESFMAQ